MCVAITYADGYPTTEGDTIHAIVQWPQGIAENSSIACALSDCDGPDGCPIFTSTPCKKLVYNNILLSVHVGRYGEEFSLSTQGGQNKEHYLVIFLTLSSGRSLEEYTFLARYYMIISILPSLLFCN